jgi:hypothetical protein
MEPHSSHAFHRHRLRECSLAAYTIRRLSLQQAPPRIFNEALFKHCSIPSHGFRPHRDNPMVFPHTVHGATTNRNIDRFLSLYYVINHIPYPRQTSRQRLPTYDKTIVSSRIRGSNGTGHDRSIQWKRRLHKSSSKAVNAFTYTRLLIKYTDPLMNTSEEDVASQQSMYKFPSHVPRFSPINKHQLWCYCWSNSFSGRRPNKSIRRLSTLSSLLLKLLLTAKRVSKSLKC